MTDRTAEATPERLRDRAGDGATVPVASMDVAPELFPTEATDDETARGAE
ncbi:hypothetical protein [Halorubrum sp. Boch-26]|nr:hypothetical protein [Halorubrum sp. Boch-26]